MIQILGAGAVAALFGETLGPLFMGKGQSGANVVLEVVQTGFLLAALWPLVRALGVGGAATAWLAGTVAALLLGFVWLRRMLPGERMAEWTTLLAAAVAALAGAAVAALAAAALPQLLGLVVGAASGLVVATALLIVLDRLLGLELVRLARVMLGSAGSSEGQQSAGACGRPKTSSLAGAQKDDSMNDVVARLVPRTARRSLMHGGARSPSDPGPERSISATSGVFGRSATTGASIAAYPSIGSISSISFRLTRSSARGRARSVPPR